MDNIISTIQLGFTVGGIIGLAVGIMIILHKKKRNG
jgi:LPXTG-motif cell wall-anchored protein